MMTAAKCFICSAEVMHLRLRPNRHKLRYRIFSLLLDLDELPDLTLRWFSINKLNIFSFYERDHGKGSQSGLKAWVQTQLKDADLPTNGPIQLYTMPRVLGYVFNPISLYFCHDSENHLCAIIYEVNNTFGERHSYLVEVPSEQRENRRIVQECAKKMHVSPFMEMDMVYKFKVTPPRNGKGDLLMNVDVHDKSGRLLVTQLQTNSYPLTDKMLITFFFSLPLMTIKVFLGIHWEAMKLFLKKIPLYAKPAKSFTDVSIIKTRKTPQ